MSRGVFLLAVFLAVLMMLLPTGTSYGSPVEEIHSMTVYIDSSESRDYDYMTWDFGDGTRADSRLTEDAVNPVHTYAEPGTYRIVQTVYRYSGGPSDSSERTVVIHGPPTVVFTSWDGIYSVVEMEERTSPEYRSLEFPEDPVREGYGFDGWAFADGTPCRDGVRVTAPMVLHATWSPSEKGTEAAETPDGGSGGGIPLVMAVAVFTAAFVTADQIRRT